MTSAQIAEAQRLSREFVSCSERAGQDGRCGLYAGVSAGAVAGGRSEIYRWVDQFAFRYRRRSEVFPDFCAGPAGQLRRAAAGCVRQCGWDCRQPSGCDWNAAGDRLTAAECQLCAEKLVCPAAAGILAGRVGTIAKTRQTGQAGGD